MEIFKEKEESQVVKITLDSEGGIIIENPDLNFDQFENKEAKSVKAKAYAAAHKNPENKAKSDLLDLDTYKHSQEDTQDNLALLGVEDAEDTLISIDELLDFLDSSEEQIDV